MSFPDIEIHPAIMFDCTNCGVENFARCVVEPTDFDSVDEDLTDMAGFFVRPPNVLVCKDCGAKFAPMIDQPPAADSAEETDNG